MPSKQQEVRLTRSTLASAALATALATVLSLPSPAQAQTSARAASKAVSGRVLVMPRPGLSEAALDHIVRGQGALRSRRIGAGSLTIVEMPAGAEMAMLERLARHPHVKFAELDRLISPGLSTSDPYAGSEWHVPKIGADRAWDLSLGSGVVIAILDTGVDASHPDLAAALVPGRNIFDNNSNTADVHGHGTKVAGAAAASANNGIGVAGVAGAARIMPVRISDTSGRATLSAMAAGLTWAADNGARVANISYVSADSLSVSNAASYLKSKGGLVTTSAGNDGIDMGITPVTTMIPVSATNSGDGMTGWSSYGAFVAMSAPGEGIFTTVAGGGYGAASGTSFSSPITAGVIALMISARPDLPATSIEQALYASAVDLGAAGRDPYYGFGRVDAYAAVRAAQQVATAVADTTAPSVAIAAPLSGGTVAGLAVVDVVASDNVGVARVELRVSGGILATDVSAPYGFSWDTRTLPNGNSTLTAVAYDSAGNKTTSAAVSVMVSNPVVVVAADTAPPVVAINNPASGASLSGNVQISVTATDNSGAAAIRQTLLIDGKSVATTTGGKLSYQWNTRKVSVGSHVVAVRALDAAGNLGQASVSVSVPGR